ncbi:hypothetical protein MTO96_012787 [Rhipicephalus appendiculatus]
MAASVAHPEIASNDAARLRTLRTVGGYTVYTVLVVFSLLRCLCASVFTVLVFIFRGRPQRSPRRAPLRPSVCVYRQLGRNGGVHC